jgi:hypothetical protein
MGGRPAHRRYVGVIWHVLYGLDRPQLAALGDELRDYLNLE